jgi:hypothetical protein
MNHRTLITVLTLFKVLMNTWIVGSYSTRDLDVFLLSSVMSYIGRSPHIDPFIQYKEPIQCLITN